MQRAPKESATGRDQAKVLGRARRKGGRCTKGRAIVDGEGEDCRQINCCGRRDEERLTRPRSDCGDCRFRSLGRQSGRRWRVEARGPGAGVSSAQQQAPQLCSGQQSGQRRLGSPQHPIRPGTVNLFRCLFALDVSTGPRPFRNHAQFWGSIACTQRIPCLYLTEGRSGVTMFFSSPIQTSTLMFTSMFNTWVSSV
jgi:hypothetical protein